MRLPSDQDDEGVAQPEAEADAQCAEHPVDGGDVGAAPDPELAGDAVGPSLLRDRLEDLLDLEDGVGLVRRAHLRLHSWRVLPHSVTFRRRARDKIHFDSQQPSSIGRNVMPMPLREVLRDPTVAAAEPLVLAGRTRLGRLVTWVHTSEVLDIASPAARRRAAPRRRGQPGHGVAARNG